MRDSGLGPLKPAAARVRRGAAPTAASHVIIAPRLSAAGAWHTAAWQLINPPAEAVLQQMLSAAGLVLHQGWATTPSCPPSAPTPLVEVYLCWTGFLMPLRWFLRLWLCAVWFLDLAMVRTCEAWAEEGVRHRDADPMHALTARRAPLLRQLALPARGPVRASSAGCTSPEQRGGGGSGGRATGPHHPPAARGSCSTTCTTCKSCSWTPWASKPAAGPRWRAEHLCPAATRALDHCGNAPGHDRREVLGTTEEETLLRRDRGRGRPSPSLPTACTHWGSV